MHSSEDGEGDRVEAASMTMDENVGACVPLLMENNGDTGRYQSISEVKVKSQRGHGHGHGKGKHGRKGRRN